MGEVFKKEGNYQWLIKWVQHPYLLIQTYQVSSEDIKSNISLLYFSSKKIDHFFVINLNPIDSIFLFFLIVTGN